jgi:hypothetical protein
MRSLPFLLLLPLAACTVGPDYQRPVVSGDTGNWIGAAPVGQVDLEPWRRMNDSVLIELIETGAAANLDVRQAEARLREARAGRDAVRGGTGPQVNATGSATTNRLSENGQLPVGQIPAPSSTCSTRASTPHGRSTCGAAIAARSKPPAAARRLPKRSATKSGCKSWPKSRGPMASCAAHRPSWRSSAAMPSPSARSPG